MVGWGYHFWEQLLPERFFDLMRSFVEMLPSLVIPTVCVLIGLRLISSFSEKYRGPDPRVMVG